MNNNRFRKILALVFVCLVGLNVNTTSFAQQSPAKAVSIEGYKKIASVPLESGTLKFLEAPQGSALAVWFDTKLSTTCSSKVVDAPIRVVLSCSGKIIKDQKPIIISGSKVAKGVRFGVSDGSSRVVIDAIGETPNVERSTMPGGGTIFLLGQKTADPVAIVAQSSPAPEAPTTAASPVAKSSKELKDQATPVPASAPVGSASSGPASVGSGPVFTPIPLPKMLHGEAELFSLVFAQSKELNGPTIKISLRANRKVEIRRDSPTKYTLKISSARLISPIFALPQPAPDGFVPFVQALASEVITPGSPVDILVQIELSRAASILVKQNAGEIEVYAGKE